MIQTSEYTLINGDSIIETKNVKTETVGFSIFSPPFADLYTYSDSINDLGNCKDYNEFFDHFSYLIPELLRITMPGRLVAVHCMDLPIQKGKEGYIGTRDFPGMLVKAFQENGFIFHDRVIIWKDPVVEMQRTKALGLLHKQIKKDSSMSRTGTPDQMVVFRKPGDNPKPITHQDKDPSKPDYIPVDLWQKIASPVWFDINQSNTLQYRAAKSNNDERHICPLQLEVIERSLLLWSNEGDTVYTPFGGIGSEPYTSVKMNRKAIAIELKESYFKVMESNMKSITEQKNQLSFV